MVWYVRNHVFLSQPFDTVDFAPTQSSQEETVYEC